MTGDQLLPAIFLILALLLGAWWLWRRWHRLRLPRFVRSRILSQWERARGNADAHRRILEADAVLDALLTALGYRGSLGEKLQKAGPYVPRLNEVWRAHKLRNRLAHEIGVQVHPRECEEAMRAFEGVVRKFCS